jgi:uncharacterized protein YidB (DUF937 family)
MGLLDSVIGALGSPQPGGGQGDLLGAVIGMLGQQSSGGLGGLGGLLQKFEQAGLGHVASSWVGTGANHPVTPDQLNGVLGDGVVANLARQLGINPQDALGQLAHMLPQVVDKLTPQGQVPHGDIGGMGDLGNLLGGLLNPR